MKVKTLMKVKRAEPGCLGPQQGLLVSATAAAHLQTVAQVVPLTSTSRRPLVGDRPSASRTPAGAGAASSASAWSGSGGVQIVSGRDSEASRRGGEASGRRGLLAACMQMFKRWVEGRAPGATAAARVATDNTRRRRVRVGPAIVGVRCACMDPRFELGPLLA